jgi:hypothetical protein
MRSLDCERLTQARAHELYPAEVPDSAPRGAYADIDALVCRPRFLDPGERPARDEAILSTLSDSVAQIAQLAAAAGEGVATWHVDAAYPESAVAAKIAVATRSDLVQRGHRVSDRVPVLAAGDIAVLARLPPRQSYSLACARYQAERGLADSDALLNLMILDERETQIHAGLCRRGRWKWLR